jgi:hypothetical protein
MNPGRPIARFGTRACGVRAAEASTRPDAGNCPTPSAGTVPSCPATATCGGGTVAAAGAGAAAGAAAAVRSAPTSSISGGSSTCAPAFAGLNGHAAAATADLLRDADALGVTEAAGEFDATAPPAARVGPL